MDTSTAAIRMNSNRAVRRLGTLTAARVSSQAERGEAAVEITADGGFSKLERGASMTSCAATKTKPERSLVTSPRMALSDDSRDVATRAPRKKSRSRAGYVPCACRDCTEVAIRAPGEKKAYCADCKAAGCPDDQGDSVRCPMECRDLVSTAATNGYDLDRIACPYGEWEQIKTTLRLGTSSIELGQNTSKRTEA